MTQTTERSQRPKGRSALSEKWAAELARDANTRLAQDHKLPDSIAAQLQDLIERDAATPGQKLPPERELAELFGVSRSSMREAMNQLVLKGLVDRRPGRGTIVLDQASAQSQALRTVGAMSSEVIEAFDFRAVVEPPIAGMAALRATKADLIRLEEACTRMDSEHSARAFAELDRVFHYRIAEACHNRLLSTLVDMTAQWIATTRISTLQTQRRRAASRRAHWRIYQAISQGDAAGSAAAMTDHIEEVAQLLNEAPARRGQ